MPSFRSVLFDLGNVLVHVDINMFWRSLGFPSAEAIAPVVPEIRRWAMEYERGAIGTERFLVHLQETMGPSYSMHQLREAFQSIICQPIEGMEEIVDAVSRSHHTALVSNTNEIHHLISNATVPALGSLPVHYVSYEIKTMKPHGAFYDAVLAGEAVPADSIVFIDDLPENVEGARKSGMHGILFTGCEALSGQLRNLGVLVK